MLELDRGQEGKAASGQSVGVTMHPDQLTVSPAIVRRLVDEQFPAWRTMPVVPVDREGTVNAIYRIGDRIAARFPLRAEDPDVVRRQLQTEASAARELSGRTRFPTPEPVALGEPGVGYPLPWAVQTWLPGVPATDADPGTSITFAQDLAELIHDLRAHRHPRPHLHRHQPWRRPPCPRRLDGGVLRPEHRSARRAGAPPALERAAGPAAVGARRDDAR